MHREDGKFYIAIQNLATGQLDVLSRAGADESPSLSPNGRMVIYATQVGDHSVLSQVSVDGRIRLTLPAREGGSIQEPAWSPFLN
jgi:TolB protein